MKVQTLGSLGRFCSGLVLLVIPLGSALAAHAHYGCDGHWDNRKSIGAWTVNITQLPIRQISVSVPSTKSVILEAVEHDVDVTLDVSDPDSDIHRQTDNPVRRNGTQRILIHGSGSGKITISLVAKEQSAPAARVEIHAYAIDEDSETSPCGEVMMILAFADETYAKGQAVSRGRRGNEDQSAQSLYLAARDEYDRAFSALDPHFATMLRADIAHMIGALEYQDLEDWHDGAVWAKRAVDAYKDIRNAYGKSRAEALLAASWMELATTPAAGSAGEIVRPESHALLQRATSLLAALVVFHEGRNELFDAALQRNNMGLASYYDGAYDSAIDAYRKAQILYVSVGARKRLAQVTQNLALVNWELGRVTAALTLYKKALALIERKESPKLYADILNNCGHANRMAGHLDLALAQHTEALEITTRIQSRREQARSLFGIASVYSAVGDTEMAANFLHQTLDIWTSNLDARGRVGALRSLALIEMQRGNPMEALRLTREALQIATDPPTRARLLAQIAESELARGDDKDAREYGELARQIARHSDPISRALIDLQDGIYETHHNQWSQARQLIRRALLVDQGLGLDRASLKAIVALAQVEAAAGNRSEALRILARGLHLAERIRVQAADPEMRGNSVEPMRPLFDLEVTLLAANYRDALRENRTADARRAALAALAISERIRGRVLAEMRQVDYTHRANPKLARLLTQKSAVLGDLAAHEHQLESIGSGQLEQTHMAAIRADVTRLREQLTLIDSRLMAVGSTRSTFTTSISAIALEQLPEDVAVLSFWLGESQAYAWVIFGRSIRMVELGQSDRLRAMASDTHRQFEASFNATRNSRVDTAEVLSDALLGPFIGELPPIIKRLVLIPDGLLHYISFAALPLRDNEKSPYLIERFDVAYAASVGALFLNEHGQPVPVNRMLIIADPVYNSDDPRWVGTSAGSDRATLSASAQFRSASGNYPLSRLPGTAVEAASISQVAGSMEVERLEGHDANRNSVLLRPLENYRYIHFAVHASIDASIPQLSSLIFSTQSLDGRPIESRLWAGDMLSRRFNADTVVFSACETAIGRGLVGEGLVGLRYVALARGAKTVLASLWPVPDRATASLMVSFYHHLIVNHRHADSALADAMREAISSGRPDPLFWAAFTATVSSIGLSAPIQN